jgi:hypothetical protein
LRCYNSDFIVFKNPIYTLIRYAGTNVLITLGINKNISAAYAFSNLAFILILVVISPFLFRLYKIDYSRFKKEIYFILPVFLIFWIRTGLLKYFLILSPIILLILSEVLSDKEVKWHCYISIVLISLLTFGYFTYSQDKDMSSDLNQIIKDYNPSYIVASDYSAPQFASSVWKDSPKFVWFEDFKASRSNQSVLRSYQFEFRPREMNLNNLLFFTAGFKRFDNATYSNAIIVSDNKNFTYEGFHNDKCYKALCVYLENVISSNSSA